MHYPLKVADLKKKLNKLRYETGRKTSRIEALMKQYEKVWKSGNWVKFCIFKVVASSDEVERGEELLEESSEGQRLRWIENFLTLLCFNLVGLHNPVNRFTHLVEVLVVLVYMASNLFKVPRERDPQNQFEADGRRDNQEEVHKYPWHAQVTTQIHPKTQSM